MKLKDEFPNDLSTKRLTVRFNTIKNPIFIPNEVSNQQDPSLQLRSTPSNEPQAYPRTLIPLVVIYKRGGRAITQGTNNRQNAEMRDLTRFGNHTYVLGQKEIWSLELSNIQEEYKRNTSFHITLID